MDKNHSEIIKGFKDGKAYKGHNVYVYQDALYSYGRHFPLAVKMSPELNLQTPGEPWFLLNGAKYSASTSQHQSITYRVFPNSPRVAFSVLSAFGFNWIDKIQNLSLVDFTEDEFHSSYLGDADFEGFENRVPVGAEYRERKDRDTGKVVYKWYHRIGAVLLKDNKGRYILLGMDENSYFGSLLPTPAGSILEAFETLKPGTVIVAEANGVKGILRQGEWFFIPRPEMRVKEKMFDKSAELPVERSLSNRHIATRLYILGDPPRYYVKGVIRRRAPNGGRGDHRQLKLEKGVIYEAVENTAVESHGANGRVD